jgi:hypothetical protein
MVTLGRYLHPQRRDCALAHSLRQAQRAYVGVYSRTAGGKAAAV